MKTGLLFTWHALKQLHDEGKLKKNIAVFFNAEHEISCPNTREIIEDLSRKSSVAITSEAARATGANVYKKKGIARYLIKFMGKSTHFGVNPQDGIDAIEELAQWIIYLKSLINLGKGIYLNPGMVSGGKSINTVPESAELSLDVRFTEYEDGKELDALIRSRVNLPFNDLVRIELEGGIKRPPMTPVAETKILQEIVEEIGKKQGHTVTWEFSGGGSDASYAAAMGIPSLCGMAATGGGLHSKDEYVETTDMETRFKIYKETLDAFSRVDLYAYAKVPLQKV
jgi:glutamate carboxypeptidase